MIIIPQLAVLAALILYERSRNKSQFDSLSQNPLLSSRKIHSKLDKSATVSADTSYRSSSETLANDNNKQKSFFQTTSDKYSVDRDILNQSIRYKSSNENSSNEQIKKLVEPTKVDKQSKRLVSIEEYVSLADNYLTDGVRVVRNYLVNDISANQLKAFDELEKGLNLIKEGISLSTDDSSKYKEEFTYFKTAHLHLESAIRLAVVRSYINGGRNNSGNTSGGGTNNFGGSGHGNRGQGGWGGFGNGGNSGGGNSGGGNSGGGGFYGYFPDDDPFGYFKKFLSWVVNIIDSKIELVKDAIIDIYKTTITNLFTSISTVFSRVSISLSGKTTQLIYEGNLAAKSEEYIDNFTQIASFTDITLQIAEDTKKITELLNESANKNSAFSILIGEFKGEMNIANNQNDFSVNSSIGGSSNNIQGDSNKVNQGDTTMTGDRNIHMGSGNYNERIQGDYVQGNYYAAGQPQSLAQAAAEIQELLKQLEQTYPTATTSQQMVVAAEAINRIESNPTMKQKVINAVKEGSLAAFEKAIDNPAGAFITGAIKGWQEIEAKD